MKRLSAALLTLIVAIAIVGCAGLVSGKSAAPQTLKVATSSVPGGHQETGMCFHLCTESLDSWGYP
jgi:ABC-type glycerol-3-phosphate transport system substrate-binding protein